MFEAIAPLVCVAIGGIMVGLVAAYVYYMKVLIPILKEGKERMLNHIQALDERISLGNEHISALNDQVKNDRLLLDVLNDQLKFRNDKIAEQKDFIMERDEIIERMEKESR